jgi:hypothetical protein
VELVYNPSTHQEGLGKEDRKFNYRLCYIQKKKEIRNLCVYKVRSRGRGAALVGRALTWQCEVLDPIPSTTKKNSE